MVLLLNHFYFISTKISLLMEVSLMFILFSNWKQTRLNPQCKTFPFFVNFSIFLWIFKAFQGFKRVFKAFPWLLASRVFTIFQGFYCFQLWCPDFESLLAFLYFFWSIRYFHQSLYYFCHNVTKYVRKCSRRKK